MAAMQLSRTHRILVGVVVSGAVIIAGIGFAGSYAAVRALAESKGFGAFAVVFPVGIDAGICVLLALDLLLTWIRIPFPLLRQAAWVLTAATIAFNGAAAWPDPLGVGMHAVIPLLFIVTVEAARHAVGRIADITADKHMEGVRLTRWLLSPVPTFLLWRRMKLWELRSYEQVIKLEQDRLIYQSRLQARFGRAWRRKAPVESLMPLRLAKYGVPLADTASAGLAAAGIDAAAAIVPAAPGAGAAAGELTAGTAAGGVDLAKPPAAQAVEPPRAHLPGQRQAPPAQFGQFGQQDWHGQERYEEQYQDPQWEQAEWAALQDGPQQDGRQLDGQSQDANPWFAAQSLPQAAYEGAYNPTYVEGLEPTPVRPPSGPVGRGAPGPEQAQQAPGPEPEPEFGPEAEPEAADAPEPATTSQAAQAEQAAQAPDTSHRDEQYYNAFRKFISENGDAPNERQLGRYLMEMYDIRGRAGGPLSENTLRGPLREAYRRFQEEMDAEHIA
ncbi:DUF2637 domain-containing protein [Streptomyces sp. NRRL F-5126]|uniref:DUF2637 domain-containing protein n=1 Tax=Streptomyces sp. NRRL F-5126 TaxID=1463857 RepID=UPI0004CC1982|nr:DUF2637 domain-containing protein [Streptomyces sp. NRRL F-5126]